MNRSRVAAVTVVGACAAHGLLSIVLAASLLTRIDLAFFAVKVANVARAASGHAGSRTSPDSAWLRQFVSSGESGLERLGPPVIVLSTPPVAGAGELGPAGAPSLPAGARERILSEDAPLALGRGTTRVVTAPVKDADDWDIVAAVGVVVHPWRFLPAFVLLGLLIAIVSGTAALAALRRIAHHPGATARALLAVGASLLAGGSVGQGWALTMRLHAAQRLSGLAESAAGAPALPHASALAFPSPFAVALLHALVAAAAVAALLAAAWLASARRRPAEVRETVAAWGFLAPSLAHLLLFTGGPLVFALYLSVHRWDLLSEARPFVGLANYRELWRDALFLNALRNTAVYSLYVPITMVLALGAALALDQRLKGIRVLRAIVFMPYVASFVAIAIVWQWIFNFDFGLLNRGLALFHLPAVDWLGNPRTALIAVMIVSAWVQLGYQMIIFLAGLQGIPEELYEAARLDGAGAWQRFRRITLPLLRPVSGFVLITGVIWSFHAFTLVYMMTEGGPVHATDVIVYQIYQNAWEFRRMGYASAMSWVLFALLMGLTLVQWRLLNRQADHE
jgi:multiple sugar transport system permease protein